MRAVSLRLVRCPVGHLPPELRAVVASRIIASPRRRDTIAVRDGMRLLKGDTTADRLVQKYLQHYSRMCDRNE